MRTVFLDDSPAITITVHQLPPAECSPNSRCHWAVRKRAGDNFADEVYYEAKRTARVRFERAIIALELIVKSVRRRDLDNWWARFKPGMDALVRAGIIPDDDIEHVQHGEITVTVDRARAPMTIITIKGGSK